MTLQCICTQICRKWKWNVRPIVFNEFRWYFCYRIRKQILRVTIITVRQIMGCVHRVRKKSEINILLCGILWSMHPSTTADRWSIDKSSPSIKQKNQCINSRSTPVFLFCFNWRCGEHSRHRLAQSLDSGSFDVALTYSVWTPLGTFVLFLLTPSRVLS